MIFWISIKIYILYISNISWKSGKIVHSFQCLHFSRASKFHSSFTCETTGPVEPFSKLIRTKCDFTRNKGHKKCITIIIFFLKDYNKMDIFGQIFAGPDESQPPLYVPLGLLPARKYTFSTLILVQSARGSFNNYVDQILPNFDPLPPKNGR